MIIILNRDATQEQTKAIEQHIVERGLRPQIVSGVERSIIGVIGEVYPELKDEFEQMPGVLEVTPISKKYKMASREFQPEDTVVQVGPVAIGDPNQVAIMAGPCAVESEKQLLSVARAVKASGANMLRGGAFKPRTSPYAFRGLGLEGLKILAKAREETGLPVVTEVMTPEDVEMVATYADMLQVGARNMQNFNLLDQVGKANKPVLLKRGMSATIEEWLLAAEYILSSGNKQVILCERGVRTFETYTRNTLDVSAIPIIKRVSHLPVIGDPSHGTGKWYLVPPVALALVAAGAHGVMVEVHPQPDVARSDGAQSLTFENFQSLMEQVNAIAGSLGKSVPAVAKKPVPAR